MERNRKVLIIGLFSAVALVVAGYFYIFADSEDPLDRYLTVDVLRGSIRRTVSATGTLQAVITVQVGSQVSGRVQELYADFNSVVKRGQLLALIDPSNFEAQLERASANLATSEAAVKMAEANLINREAELLSSQANVEAGRIAHQEAARQLRRDQELFRDRLISERDLESGQASFDETRARVEQSEAQVSQVKAAIRSAQAQLEQAKASVKQARAELRSAEVNLRYTKITSPIDGVVVERNVDMGQTVAASFQAPVLFLIANDLSKMRVIAQIDEADIGAISERARVDFNVDAFPEETFTGGISEIRLSSKLPDSSASSTSATAGGATNVVVYNVIIDVDNPQLKLRPNMTANATFTVASTEDVLKVANSALRYRPPGKSPEEIRELLSSAPATSKTASRSQAPEGQLAHSQPGDTKPDFQNHSYGDGNGVSRRWDAKPNREGARSANSTQPVIGPSTIERYGIKAGPKIHFPQAEKFEPTRGLLWVLEDSGQPQPRRVRFGITDGRETAVLTGLEEGEQVITWEMTDESEMRQSTSPFSGVFGRRRSSSSSSRSGQRRGGR